MRIAACIFLATLMIGGSPAAADTSRQAESAGDWQARCEELKNNQDSSLMITFTEKPIIDLSIRHWSLSWNGIDIPIPPVSFKEVYVKRGSHNLPEVTMLTGDGLVLNLLVFDDSLAGEASAESVKSQDIGRYRPSESMLLGYRITPKNLTCRLENRADETSLVNALILKGIGRPGKLEAVYRDAGIYSGWIEAERNGGRSRYVVNIIPKDDSEVLYQMNYIMAADSKYISLPFLIGNNRQTYLLPSPAWLPELNAAMSTGAAESWKRYATMARKAGISEKSIQRVLKSQGKEG